MRSSRAGHFPVTSTPAVQPRDAGGGDAELVRAAQTGDRGAFGLLYRRYARMVHGILLARVPRMSAEDLMQDVFLHALSRVASLRDSSRFGGWLAAIARNRAVDFHRQARPAEELDARASAESDYVVRNQSRSGGDAEAAAILDAILTLPDAYRETLILRLVEGMTGPEIAERTGLTYGSVRVNLHRGMQQLRKILGERGEAGAATETPKEGRR